MCNWQSRTGQCSRSQKKCTQLQKHAIKHVKWNWWFWAARLVAVTCLTHSLTLDQFLEPSADGDFWPSCWNEACKIQRPVACRSRFFVVATLETTRCARCETWWLSGALEPQLGQEAILELFSESARAHADKKCVRWIRLRRIKFIRAPPPLIHRYRSIVPSTGAHNFVRRVITFNSICFIYKYSLFIYVSVTKVIK